MSPSSKYVFSVISARNSFHSRSSSPRNQRLYESLSPSGSSACQEIKICWPVGRESVCAWVPAALVASPVSVTVMEKAEDALELTLFAAPAGGACADTVMLRREGGLFCGK